MRKILAIISGPINASEDDMINGGREAIARAGYQVGWYSAAEFAHHQDNTTLMCLLEVDDRLHDKLKQQHEIDIAYGDYAVTSVECKYDILC